MRPDDDRLLPRTKGGMIYLVVLAMAVVGLGITGFGSWRTGVSWIGSALLVASAGRLVLSERSAGMLRVRRRWSDVTMMALVGVALIVLAVIVPDQPGR